MGDWAQKVGKQFDQARRLCLEHAALMGDQIGHELAERTVALCEHGQANLHQITSDKAHRWLGFIEGVLASAGVPMSTPSLDGYCQPGGWQEVQSHLLDRYHLMATQNAHKIDARLGRGQSHRLEKMSACVNDVLASSEDAANHYLGFIQGMLIAAGVIGIESERDYTRPLFHRIKGASPSHDARRPQGRA